MKSTPDCLPCILGQILAISRQATDDLWLHRKVLLEAMQRLPGLDMDQTPAELTHQVLRAAGKSLGNPDPLQRRRAQLRREGQALAERLGTALEAEKNPDAAIKLALHWSACANEVDAWTLAGSPPRKLEHLFPAAPDGHPALLPFGIDEREAFLERLAHAPRLIFVADNAGELAVDALLLRAIRRRRPDLAMAVVVHSQPILTDGLSEDAALALGERTELVDLGSDVPGLPLSACTSAFKEFMEPAALVLTKGQANYETYADAGREFFALLWIKCKVMAEHLGVGQGRPALVFKN